MNTRRTAYPNHLLPPTLVALDEGHDDGCPKIAQARCYGAHHGDVAIVSKLGNFGVVFLEDTKGKRES